MKRNGVNKLLMVWLLLAIFMVPVITQTVHAFHNDDCGGTCSHTEKKEHRHNHDCKTCYICKFTFSQFVESESFHSFIVLSRFHQKESVTFQEKIYDSLPITNHLRGPPQRF